MERPERSEDDMIESKLFWNCKNYEEYAVACDMQGIPKLWKKDEFEWLHGLNTFDKK